MSATKPNRKSLRGSVEGKKMQKTFVSQTPTVTGQETIDIQKDGIVPVSFITSGPYKQPATKKDMQMETIRQYQTSGKQPFGPLGPLDPFQTGEYLMSKQKEQERFDLTTFATALINPKDPRTQMHAFEIAPQLKEIPQKAMERSLKIQVALHNMLFSGYVGGEQDFELLFEMLDPRFIIPVFPLYDARGEIMEQIKKDPKFKSWVAKSSGVNTYQPWQNFGGTAENKQIGELMNTEYWKISETVKEIIYKRLLPGLSDKPIADVKEYIKNMRAQRGMENVVLNPGDDVSQLASLFAKPLPFSGLETTVVNANQNL